MHCKGGVCQGGCLPGGGAYGGVCPGGVIPACTVKGVSAQVGVCPGGAYGGVCPGGVIPACTGQGGVCLGWEQNRMTGVTRMHSSKIRPARSSSHQLGEGSVSVHAGIHPQAWAWRPNPPMRPLKLPHGCGPGDPPSQTPQLPSWVWAWRPSLARPLKLHPGCGPGYQQGMLGYHSPRDLQGMCRGITPIHRSPSRPRLSSRLTADVINIHEHLI